MLSNIKKFRRRKWALVLHLALFKNSKIETLRSMGDFMKLLWLALTIIPAPFLFHFYEYGQHVKGEEARFLLPGTIVFVVLTGALAGQLKVWHVILIHIITGISSLFLAAHLIPDDGGWFKPIGRDLAIIMTAILFLVGQLLVRIFFCKKGNPHRAFFKNPSGRSS